MMASILMLSMASLRGAKRRSNPDFLLAFDCFASLAMTASARSDHYDPAAQHGAGRAEPSQELRFGAAGVRLVAADLPIMVAGDQQALIAKRSDQRARDVGLPTAYGDVRVGRAGVA